MTEKSKLEIKTISVNRKRWPLYKIQSLPPNKFMEVVNRVLNGKATIFLPGAGNNIFTCP